MDTSYKKILTVQDISCVGQCSLTVALPILSACGMETCILPSAVLSTHTGGFTGFTFRDLTDDMPKIADHWQKEKISFDAVYTGYLGSARQIDYVKRIVSDLMKPDAPFIADPAMADAGKLYYGFDDAFVAAMARLVAVSDIALPNITEACFLTGTEYKETYDESYIAELCRRVCALGAKTTVLTGVSYREGRTGVVVYGRDGMSYYEHERISKGCHGTGDVYASAFVGAYLNGKTIYDAARIAADYTVSCIKETQGDPDHWYGVKFERLLPELAEAIRNG
ncbi:MAG: pyridoxamine kinase [Clostridia bacterium]|nr:pyridoxamine kinase [Clostridia bacterium]